MSVVLSGHDCRNIITVSRAWWSLIRRPQSAALFAAKK